MNGPQWGGVGEAAREWHRLGYRLVAWPMRQGKVPNATGWGRAAADPLRVTDADNIGVNHALSGTACIDVDHLPLSRVVFEYLGLDIEALKASTLSYCGRPDRVKLLFRAPSPALGVRKLRVRINPDDREPTTVLELRGAADGKQAQDVLPPSIHPTTGEPYMLLTALRSVAELPPLPPALLDLWHNWNAHEPALKRALGDADAIRKDGRRRRSGGHNNVIGAFNGRHSVGEILERNGYERRGPRWLRPDSTTGVAGVVLMPAGDAVISFGGGVLGDERPHDAFDCYCLLEHRGDTHAAVRTAAELLGMTRAANDDSGAVDVTEAWPEPQPLPSALPAVETFDIELLPDSLRGYVVDIAERMQAPVDYPAVMQLAMLGGLLGRRVGILPKRYDEWYVVPNLWGFIVGRPSMMKSPVISAVFEPVRELDREAAARFASRTSASASSKLVEDAVRETKRKAAQDAARKGDVDKAHELARLVEVADADAPKRERFTTNDTTVEKLGELLADNPNGLIVMRDELTGFFLTFERQGHEGDRAFYLECWNGTQPYTCDRIGRGTVDVPAACVSIVGGIQPSRLETLVRDLNGSGDDGLLQRFQLVTWPDVPSGFQVVDRFPDPKARAAAASVAMRFASISGRLPGSHPGAIPLLRFDEEAQDAFLAWYEQHGRRMREGAEHPAIESHLTKYNKLVPALALILHLCDHEGGPVSLAAVQRAIGWARYLESHARRVYAPAIRPDVDAAHALVERIRSGALGERFGARDVYVKGWSRLADVDTARGALALLVEAGWLRRVELQTDGRPAEVYIVNPRVVRRAA